ncbi:hypothetical protein ACHAPT_007190 [Fusarium lateritium]
MEDASSTPAKPLKRPSALNWWSSELCCLLSLASLAAQVGVLAHYNGKPQDSWPSQTLTLNALIATLSTICRISMMFTVGSLLAQAKWNRFSSGRGTAYFPLRDYALLDEASRGSWGSARILFRFKGSHVACIGAALSILSQAFGLFSQQLVSLRTDWVETRSPRDTGQVARTTWLASELWEDARYRYQTATRLAMYTGFLAPSIGAPPVHCPTGNCTWPIIPTIGVCGRCLNLTDEISFNSINESTCILKIPGGMELEKGCDDHDPDAGTVFRVGPGSGRVFTSSLDTPERYASNVIAEFGAIGLPGSVVWSDQDSPNEPHAAECALWYCVRARKARVSLGVLKDEVTETWGEVVGEGTFIGNITFVNIPSSMGTALDEKYSVSKLVVGDVGSYANRTFQGSVEMNPETVEIITAKTEFALGLFNAFDDMHAWMDRLAGSMTNAVRINGTEAPAGARYWGTAMSSQVIMVVRWEWVIYPVVMVGASMVYLVVEIERTERIGVRPWKDDPLLPVCMEIDEEMRQQASRGLNEPGGIEKRVGEYSVRLEREDGFSVGFVRRPSGSG